MKPTFTETVNDASQTRIVNADAQPEAPEPKRRPRAAATPEEVSDADPT